MIGCTGAWMLPPVRPWICIDIETVAGSPEEIDAEFRREWAPSQKWKPETVGRRWFEAREKYHARGALLDSGNIAAIAARSPFDLIVLHAVKPEVPRKLNDIFVEGFADEKAMLETFGQWLDNAADPDTVVVGHNLSFDLAKLRLRSLANGLALPIALAAPDLLTCDTMRLFCRRFSMSDRPMIGLADACDAVGIAHHKHLMSGAAVGGLIERGEVDQLVRYAAADALVEAELFLTLTGKRV